MFSTSDAKIIWEICHRTYSTQPLFTLPSNPLSKCFFSFAPFFFFSLFCICNLKQETVAWQRISWCIMKNTITNSSQENAPFSNCLIEKRAMGRKIFTPSILTQKRKNIMARNFLHSRKKIMLCTAWKTKLSFLITYSEPDQFFRLRGVIME